MDKGADARTRTADPFIRVTAKEGSQSPPVPLGPGNKPKPRTPKDSEEPEDA